MLSLQWSLDGNLNRVHCTQLPLSLHREEAHLASFTDALIHCTHTHTHAHTHCRIGKDRRGPILVTFSPMVLVPGGPKREATLKAAI